MKIGVVHTMYDLLGGAEQTTKHILQALVNNRYDTTLYTITEPCVRIPDGVHIKKRRLLIRNSLFVLYETNNLFKCIKDCDLVLVSTGGLCLPPDKFNKKTIIYCHSTFESDLNATNTNLEGKFWLYNKYRKKYKQKQINMLKNSSLIYIANSLYTKNKIKELFNIDSLVIYPPVVMETITNESKRDNVMTISRFSSDKNLEFNIKVMKEIPVQYKIHGNMNMSNHHDYFKKIKYMSKNYPHIKFFVHNAFNTNTRKKLEADLYSTKVYFQSTKETFGISVVESIMAGCIPIVPNNGANKETVPFKELRFKENDIDDAKDRVKSALAGSYDKYLPDLKEHAKQFTKDQFYRNITSYVSEVLS